MAMVLAVCQCQNRPTRWCTLLRGDQGGHRLVGVAANGDEAERLLTERRPDLILVDLPSFREEGPELCRRLAVAGEASGESAPVIAFAPRLDDGERAALLEAGASGYVLTAIDDASLSTALQAIADVAGTGKIGSTNGHPPVDR